MTKDEMKAALKSNYLRIEEDLERQMHGPHLIEALLEKQARAKGEKEWER